jgi:cell division protein FtsN
MRVFDGTEDDEDVEGSRLPLLIVLALLVLAMFAGVVWLAYTQGVARGRTETPVLTAANGPARVAPQNPAAAEQPYKGFKIYEQPAPPDDEVDATTPAAKPAQVAATPAPAAPKPVVAAAPPAPAPKIAAAMPAPATVKPVPAPAKAAVTKSELPPPAASAPIGAATTAPRSLALIPAKPSAAPAAPTPVAAPASAADGAYVLQIGAYKSQGDADAAWAAYKAKHAALLSGAGDNIQQADLGDKGIWYRLRVVGFPSKDVASAMCERLKADGGNCFLGK